MKSTQDMTKFSFASGANAAFIDGLYSDYLKDPSSVDQSWKLFFEGFEFASTYKGGNADSGDSTEAKVEAFINLYRRLGHLSADLNPLESKPALSSDLLAENHGLAQVQDHEVFHPANLPVDGPMSFGEIKSLLEETYCLEKSELILGILMTLMPLLGYKVRWKVSVTSRKLQIM